MTSHWGGTNDSSISESLVGLRHRRTFVSQNKHTNIITVTPPPRHDLPNISCVNKETNVQQEVALTTKGHASYKCGRQRYNRRQIYMACTSF